MATTAVDSTSNAVFEDLQRSVKQPTKELGKDEFLKLLTYQLKAQNPLKPQDGQEFASQLAQFSSLEQLTNINKALQAQSANFGLLSQAMANANAPNYIGKSIKASAESITYDGAKPPQFGYELGSNAASVKIEIKNSAGAVVRTINPSALEMQNGEHRLTWDGKADNGTAVASGQYSINITAKDASGGLIDAKPFAYGVITAVRFKQEGTVAVVNGVEIPIGDIEDIAM
ncbi:MAG: flagellar hook capping protein [Ignavibacteriae bacterium]|nr:flagellar hook capping protein [Ignavibacteriota bacterium]